MLYAASDRRLIKIAPDTQTQLAEVEFTGVKIQHMVVSHDAVFVAGVFHIEYGFVAKLELTELFKDNSAREATENSPQDLQSLSAWCLTDLPSPVTCLNVAVDTVVIGDRQGELRSLDASTGESNWICSAHSKLITCVTSLTTSKGTRWIASGDWGGKIVVSEAGSGKQIESYALHRGALTDLLAFHGQPTRLVSTSRDGTVRLWYIEQHRLVRFHRQPAPVLSASRWQDDTVLTSTRHSELMWIDLSSAECTQTAQSPIDYIHAQATSPNYIAISNGRNRVLLANRSN
ncbi:MAG: hypothetical protein Aurels2KO_33250 [Aureliella sp.]